MKFSFLLFVCSLGSTLSFNTNFIKDAVGPTTIECSNGSIFVTNATKYLNFNLRPNCEIRKHNKVIYVCLKKEFDKRQCQYVTHGIKLSTDGCYVGDSRSAVEVEFIHRYYKYFYIFVLEMSVARFKKEGQRRDCFAFCQMRFEETDRVNLNKNSWILLKVSNKSEDFADFFMEGYPMTSPAPKLVTSAVRSVVFPRTVTTERIKNEGFKVTSTAAPKKDTWSASKVFIILGSVVIFLLIVFLLVAFTFYRKRLKNNKRFDTPETSKSAKEILPVENQTGSRVKSVGSESSDQYDETVFNVLYESSLTEDRSQTKVESPNWPESTQNSDVVYSTVMKKKQTNDPLSTESPAHVVVNGDLYAMVEKEKEPLYENPSPKKELVREEVNGDLYAVVSK